MSSPSSNLKGILLMLAATAAFIINDSFLKFIMADVPPFETAFLRAIAIVVVSVPLIVVTGQASKLPKVFAPKVLGRNGLEFVAMLGYLVGLANAPIADMTALAQISPILILIAAAVFFGARISRAQILLVGFSFIGVLMVAQPGGSGFSPYALFGLGAAFAIALRDIIGRSIARDIPGFVVTTGLGVITIVGAGIATFVFEDFVVPNVRQVALIFASALFVTVGHLCVFLSYRAGAVEAVAPFAYASTIWALIAGAVVFGTLPNTLALCGIALIGGAGVAMVVLENRRRWLAVATA